jgi:TRAP-type C4-dicarboxylate transport system permease small subunit
VLVAAGSALATKITGSGFESWHDDVVRACTVGIAMIGAAFASHQTRHLSMDLVSRRLSPRARLFLRIGLLLVTIFVAALIVNAGLDNRAVDLDTESNRMTSLGFIERLTTISSIDLVIIFGGLLIIVHSLLHILIDADYIVRHKLPPERQRSGH